MANDIPTWAGGVPANAPPRPGTAEYDAYRKEIEAKSIQSTPQTEKVPKLTAISLKGVY
jgi:hypothetical protein